MALSNLVDRHLCDRHPHPRDDRIYDSLINPSLTQYPPLQSARYPVYSENTQRRSRPPPNGPISHHSTSGSLPRNRNNSNSNGTVSGRSVHGSMNVLAEVALAQARLTPVQAGSSRQPLQDSATTNELLPTSETAKISTSVIDLGEHSELTKFMGETPKRERVYRFGEVNSLFFSSPYTDDFMTRSDPMLYGFDGLRASAIAIGTK